MSNFWLTQFILHAVGWGFIGVVALALTLAVWLPKLATVKAAAAAAVLAVAAVPVYKGHKEYQANQAEAQEYNQRLASAQKLFEQRCTGAGEKIYKVVEGVSGVYLINPRTRSDTQHQFDKIDPAGDSSSGEGYPETFFLGHRTEFGQTHLLTTANRSGAYRFVEMPAKDGNGFIRYSDVRPDRLSENDQQKILLEERTHSREARFGVEWADVSTREDRESWIGGSRIRVIDLQTQEIVAERIGYVMDQGQGSRGGGRQPWSFARDHACPEFPKLHDRYPYAYGLTRNFVEKVLKP